MKRRASKRICFQAIWIVLLFVFLAGFAKRSHAQIILDEAPKQRYYDRLVRVKKFKEMKDFRDVFHYNKMGMGTNRFSGHFSYNWGRVKVDNGVEKRDEYRQAIGFYARYRFLEEFFVNVNLFKDFNPKAEARWISNFTYSLGRYNWRNKKINFGYENYVNNKYTDNVRTLGNKFLEGFYFASYNLFLNDSMTKWIRLDQSTSLRFTGFVRYAIKYRDENEIVHGGIAAGKTILGVSARYTIYKNIYGESALYFYPEASIKKQPWDPDYSYGFGYFDYRSFRLSLTYGNWVINRFSWNKQYYPSYGFLDGNFRLTANWIW